jgi:hypothetical protein
VHLARTDKSLSNNPDNSSYHPILGSGVQGVSLSLIGQKGQMNYGAPIESNGGRLPVGH